MICVDDCGTCIHQRPLKDGWRFVCDAFPEGAPQDFDYSKVRENGVCNNGIGYEPKEQSKD